MPTGIPGNVATLAVGKQSAKGTPQTTPTYKLKFTGGDIAPTEDTVQVAETDSSIQDGQTLKVGYRVEGSSEHYLRPDDFGLLAYLALGANSDSGATNFTHVATLASAQPYATGFKAYNSTTLVDRYSDMRIGQLVVNGQSGGILTCGITWAGLDAVLGSTDPVLAVETQTPLVYPQVVCTIGGAAPGTVRSFSVTVNRNGQFVPGDSGVKMVDWLGGRVSVSGEMVLLFETDAKYRAFHTGTTGGTAPSTTVFNEALNITATVNANLSVAFDFAAIEYTNVSVPFNVDGSAIAQTLAWRSKPSATISQYVSITTKNQTASY